MAQFENAYTLTAGIEAGWNVDNGGQTYKGISRKGWPKWEGWQIIDRYIKTSGIPKRGMLFNSKELDNLIVTFYKKNYWDKIYGDKIYNQTVANFIYDFFVNSNAALLMINRALGARESNTINEGSLKIINDRPAFAYLVIYNLRKEHYEKLSLKPKLRKFKAGWIARLKSFPSSIAGVAGIGSIGAYSSKEVYNILEKKGTPALQNGYRLHSAKDVATRYANITEGLERIVKSFPDAQIKRTTGFAVIAYNGGNGIVKIALHTPAIYHIIYNAFMDAKIKYA